MRSPIPRPRPSHSGWRALSLLTASLALSATAQESPGPELPAIHINAAAEASPSLTVTSLQAAQAQVREKAGGVSVIDAESYKTGRATTLKDALDFAPGVYVQPRFGAEEARISIRGSGIQRTFHGRGLKLLQDGVPLNLADGGFDMQAIEPLSASYIEVFRGANALRYGSTTLGGAINFVTPTGHDAPRFQARAEGGSFDTFRAQLSTGEVMGNVDYYATATQFHTQGYREHSEQNTQRFFSNVGVRINDDVETRFYFTYVRTDSELPGNLTKEQLHANPRQAARNAFMKMFDYVDSDWKRDFELFRVANKTTIATGEDAWLTLSTFYSYKDLDHPILFVIDQVSHDLGLDINHRSEAELLGRKNALTLGFSPVYGIVEDTRFANVLGRRGGQFSDSYQQALNLDFYGENLHYLTDRLAFSLGGQVTYARRDNEDRFPVSPANPDHSSVQDWWGFSPKAGFVFDATETSQWFINVSRSFEPPSFGELTAPAVGGAGLIGLEAQTATTLEIGTRGETAKGRVRWDVAAYSSWIDDELMELSVAPGLTQTINAGRTLHRGVEFGLELSLLEGILLESGASVLEEGKGGKAPVVRDTATDRVVLRHHYLWSHFTYDGDHEFGDNRLPGIPEHYYRADLLYEHPCGIYFGPGVEWVPDAYPVDSANTLHADSYALLSFKVGYRTQKGLSFYVEGRNLTDEAYAATTGVISRAGPFNSNQFLPGDGRSVFFGLEYKY